MRSVLVLGAAVALAFSCPAWAAAADMLPFPEVGLAERPQTKASGIAGICSPESINSPLRKAVRNGDARATRRLVARGADVNEYAGGRTVLTYFNRCEFLTGPRFRTLGPRHYAMIPLLKELGFDYARFGTHVLDSTIGELIDMPLVETLVESGATVRRSTLETAMFSRQAALFTWLLRNGGDPHDEELMMEAAYRYSLSPRYIMILLEFGAKGPTDPDRAQSLRKTLIVEEAPEPLGILIERNAPPRTCPPAGQGSDMECGEAFDLHMEAVNRGLRSVVDVLHAKKVPVTSVNWVGYTALHQLVDRDARARERAEQQGEPPPPAPSAKVTAAAAALVRNDPAILNVKTRWNDTPRTLARRHAVTDQWLEEIVRMGSTDLPEPAAG